MPAVVPWVQVAYDGRAVGTAAADDALYVARVAVDRRSAHHLMVLAEALPANVGVRGEQLVPRALWRRAYIVRLLG